MGRRSSEWLHRPMTPVHVVTLVAIMSSVMRLHFKLFTEGATASGPGGDLSKLGLVFDLRDRDRSPC